VLNLFEAVQESARLGTVTERGRVDAGGALAGGSGNR